MERKYKCKYCDKMITQKNGACSWCRSKIKLVRKLLRMVKEYSANEKGETS